MEKKSSEIDFEALKRSKKEHNKNMFRLVLKDSSNDYMKKDKEND